VVFRDPVLYPLGPIGYFAKPTRATCIVSLQIDTLNRSFYFVKGLPQNWGQAATGIGGDGSLAGWNFCPKPEPSVPL
jgi:hypothetical protein